MGVLKSLFEKIQRRRNYIDFLRKQGVKIGERCEIYATASFGSEPYLISLGDHVRVNSGVNFVTHDGGVWVLRDLDENLKNADMFGKITVGNNVHIGTNAIIMPGVNIGNNCIIGCGAIVTKSIPDNSIAVGIPARVIESIDEYKQKHINDFDITKALSREDKEKYLNGKFSVDNNI
jgi:acetyltransferase-like isoleucine patch superfamily enzyme